MNAARSATASVVTAAAIDAVVVLVFAAVGRVSHDENPLGFVVTAWPFLVGLAMGWLVMRAWRHPRRIVWAGLGVWVITVAGGMLVRLATGQGTAPAFIVVATLTLALGLIGWRAVALLLARRSRRRAAS